MSVVDWGRGVQHQQGWRGRKEREALGLPTRSGVPKPGTRASVLAETRDRLALAERENATLRQRVARLNRAVAAPLLIERLEKVAVRLERLFELGIVLPGDEPD